MNDIRLLEVTRKQTSEHAGEINYRFEHGGRTFDTWFQIAGVRLPELRAEAFLPAVLFPAMNLGANIIMDVPVSAELLRGLTTIQEICACWHPESFRPVSIIAPPLAQLPGAAGVASFFSAGVDSFHTLLKHPDELGTLLLVHGFDIPIDHSTVHSAVAAAVRDIAARMNKNVIEVRTNIREFADLHVTWGMYYGSVLASVGLLLSPLFSKIYIPSSHSYCDLMASGSHPLTDPCWSTEHTKFIHDSGEATRVQKVAAISQSDLAMNTLRVCWVWKDGQYNCGRCDKCLRTMINLYAAGALGRCKTLPPELDLETIGRATIRNSSIRSFAEENLRALRARGADPAVIKAIEAAITGRYERGIWRLGKKVRRWYRKKILRISKVNPEPGGDTHVTAKPPPPNRG
jgi:hypothetical protein